MPPPAQRVSVFAVEPTSIQIVWGSLARGAATLTWNGGRLEFQSTGGPGGLTVDELDPATTFDFVMQLDGQIVAETTGTTMADDLGAELARFATMSDLHLGTARFGLTSRMTEPGVPVERAHPVRCAEAAVAEALEWGAQRIVIKGDVTHASHAHSWTLAGDVFGACPVPVDMIPGNHDRCLASTVDPYHEAARFGATMHRDVSVVDIDGLRIVFVDSTVSGIDIGVWRPHRSAMRDAVAEAEGPAMIVVHHQPQSTPWPMYLPRGIPSIAANPIIANLRRANPKVIGTSGHTHRNRSRFINGVRWTEVGSTKDYPGVWAGYVVHERGIRQVVKRIVDPSCITWTEYTRRAVLGAWGAWSPGTLEQRSFSHPWVG